MTFHRSPFQPGARIGRVIVIERSMESADDSGGMLELRCDCGYEFRITAQRAREIAHKGSLACRLCRIADPGKPCLRRLARSKACSWCHQPGHSRRECPTKPSAKPERHCGRCSDLEHRRDVPKCLRCGQPYRAEPPVTLSDVLESRRENRTVFPEVLNG